MEVIGFFFIGQEREGGWGNALSVRSLFLFIAKVLEPNSFLFWILRFDRLLELTCKLRTEEQLFLGLGIMKSNTSIFQSMLIWRIYTPCFHLMPTPMWV